MIRSAQRATPVGLPFLLLLSMLLLALMLSWQHDGPLVLPAKAATDAGLSFDYEIVEGDLTADWADGPGFDPRGKCPPDFFSEGFVLVCKKLADGAYFKFLYHRGRKLLYRIDKDVINGQSRIGLHWVESTRFGARYRVADPAFKGGRTLEVPTGKGKTQTKPFQYGEAVSKKRVQPGRELFHATHIDPDQCPDWQDLLNFMP